MSRQWLHQRVENLAVVQRVSMPKVGKRQALDNVVELLP
jgi:hypothetical protein